MKKEIKIAISGKSGCGNSTVTSLVSEKLGLKMINFTFRQLALEMKMDFEKLCKLSMKDFSYDKELDRRQVEMSKEGDCVLGSRLAIWMLKDADLKIFLTAEPLERAKRIHKREGGDLKNIIDFTKTRDKNDRERYKKIYGLDNNDYSFADLIICTNRLNQYQVADIIVEAAKTIL